MATARKKSEPTRSPAQASAARATSGQTAESGAAVSVIDAPGLSEPQPITDDQLRAFIEGGDAAGAGGPTLNPPGIEAEAGAADTAAGAVTGTWRSGMTVTAMWSINETRNAYMNVAGLGWRRLYSGRDGSFMALVLLAGQARQTGKPITFREEADGMVHEIYLW